MKHIIAHIRPSSLEEVTLALCRIPHLPEINLGEVRGFSSDQIPTAGHPMGPSPFDFTPYVRLETFCDDDQAYEIKYALQNAARTGGNGDGHIYVSDVREGISIRTAERREPAL